MYYLCTNIGVNVHIYCIRIYLNDACKLYKKKIHNKSEHLYSIDLFFIVKQILKKKQMTYWLFSMNLFLWECNPNRFIAWISIDISERDRIWIFTITENIFQEQNMAHIVIRVFSWKNYQNIKYDFHIFAYNNTMDIWEKYIYSYENIFFI